MGREIDKFSILQEDREECYWCHRRDNLENHHVFEGNVGNKNNSEKYGLLVTGCHWCHNEPPNGVHHNKRRREILQDFAQRACMEYWGMTEDEFRVIFRKSYLLED